MDNNEKDVELSKTEYLGKEEGTEGGRRPSGVTSSNVDTEAVIPGKRRRFTKAYKLEVLEKVVDIKISDLDGLAYQYLAIF